MSNFLASGIWSWHGNPVVTAGYGKIIGGCLAAGGKTIIYRYGLYDQKLQWSHIDTFTADDHCNPAVFVLGKENATKPHHVVVVGSEHGGAMRSHTSGTPFGIGSWYPPVTIEAGGSGGLGAAYGELFELQGVLYVHYRFLVSAGPNVWQRRVRTSTDGGLTWSDSFDLLQNNPQRPYVHAVKTASNRVDFWLNDANTDDVEGSGGTPVLHFYMTVDAAGTRSYFKSDGTALGTDANLPFATSALTTVWTPSGSETNSKIWGFYKVGSTLYGLFVTFTVGGAVHTYRRATWTGSAWTTEAICTGGDDNYQDIYPDATRTQPFYSGGICGSELDANIVYVSRKYAAGDARVEQWTKTGGTWGKTADISGNTSTINARPWFVSGSATEQIMYWSGTYSTYLTWTTSVKAWPDLTIATYAAAIKPGAPAINALHQLPSMVQCWPFTNGSGATVTNFATGGTNGTVVGAPTWATGSYGPEMAGFSVANYVQANAAGQPAWDATYPCWMAYQFRYTGGTVRGYLGSLGNSGSTNQWVGIWINATGDVAGPPAATIRENTSSAGPTLTGTTVCNDGVAHTVVLTSWAANYHTLHVDGNLEAYSTTTLGTITTNRVSIGALGRSTVSLPFPGTIIAAAIGRGGTYFDPAQLCWNWNNGIYGEINSALVGYTVDPTGAGDFATLSEAVSLAPNLGGASALEITVYKGGDVGNFVLTSVGCTGLSIFTYATDRHDGKDGDTDDCAYVSGKIRIGTADSDPIRIVGLRLDDRIILTGNTTATFDSILAIGTEVGLDDTPATTSTITLQNCIFCLEVGGTATSCVALTGGASSTVTSVIDNCTIEVASTAAGITTSEDGCTTTIENVAIFVAGPGTALVDASTVAAGSNNLSSDTSFALWTSSLVSKTAASCLVSPGSDWHLKAQSSAIDAGKDTGVIADAVGTSRPRGAAYDIGALEYIPTLGGVCIFSDVHGFAFGF